MHIRSLHPVETIPSYSYDFEPEEELLPDLELDLEAWRRRLGLREGDLDLGFLFPEVLGGDLEEDRFLGLPLGGDQ